MISLVLASAVSLTVVCTNCNGTGHFVVDCPRCSGRGIVDNPRFNSKTLKALRADPTMPCPDCVRGLSAKVKTGSGKKKVTCKVCFGKKKIRR